MDLSHAARRARQRDGRHDGGVGFERRRAHHGRLDDAHRERRAAARAAAAAARSRAQRRRDAVGLGCRLVVHARRDHDRQERSDRQRLRPRLRGVRGPWQAHGARSDRERLLRAHDSDARGRAPSAVALSAAGDAVELLGHAASVGSREPRRSAQSDDGSQGPRLDDVEDPQRGAGVVPRRLEPQVRAVLPAELQQSPGLVLRPRDGRVPLDRHLLRDASLAVRQRPRSDACTSTSCSGRSSAGSTRASTTARATSKRRRAGARKSSTATATARSRSRGTCPANPRIRAATRRFATTSTR